MHTLQDGRVNGANVTKRWIWWPISRTKYGKGLNPTPKAFTGVVTLSKRPSRDGFVRLIIGVFFAILCQSFFGGIQISICKAPKKMLLSACMTTAEHQDMTRTRWFCSNDKSSMCVWLPTVVLLSSPVLLGLPRTTVSVCVWVSVGGWWPWNPRPLKN